MADNISFEERAERLVQLTRNSHRLNKHGMIQKLAIADQAMTRVRAALNIYLWTCLSEAFGNASYALSNDMLKDYENDIFRLPNITPNGLVLPKRENILAFNLLQRETGIAFEKLGFGEAIARIQYPVNVRLQSGKPNPAVDSRPRASAKPHSDIWAGDPASGILTFLSVLGDPHNSGIKFYEPSAFPKSYVRTLEDYNDGIELMKEAKEVCSFDAGGWFLVDPYLIHHTTKTGSGARISLDFRFITKKRVTSDIDEDATRKPFFINYDDWSKLGDSKWITTSESLHSPFVKEDYTTGYPVKISITDIEPHHETERKRAAN